MSNYPDNVTGNEIEIAGYLNEPTETGVYVFIDGDMQDHIKFDNMSDALEGAKALLGIEYGADVGTEDYTATFELELTDDVGETTYEKLDTTLTFNPKDYSFIKGRK